MEAEEEEAAAESVAGTLLETEAGAAAVSCCTLARLFPASCSCCCGSAFAPSLIPVSFC